jgi:hypothetical protein
MAKTQLGSLRLEGSLARSNRAPLPSREKRMSGRGAGSEQGRALACR